MGVMSTVVANYPYIHPSICGGYQSIHPLNHWALGFGLPLGSLLSFVGSVNWTAPQIQFCANASTGCPCNEEWEVECESYGYKACVRFRNIYIYNYIYIINVVD